MIRQAVYPKQTNIKIFTKIYSKKVGQPSQDLFDDFSSNSDNSDSNYSSQNQSSDLDSNSQENNFTAKIEATPPPKCQMQALLCDTMLKSIHRKDRFEESLSCSSAFNSTNIFNSSYTCNETTTFESVPLPKSEANYEKCPSPHLCQMFVDQCRLSTDFYAKFSSCTV